MQKRQLGEGGPSVSAIGLGCMNMSITGRPTEEASIKAIHAALDAGVTLLDTANVYCLDDDDLGHNERLIARALKGRTEKVTIASKGGLRRPRGAWTRDASPASLVSACEASLIALGVAQIDVYQLHAPDPDVPFADSIGALAKLRQDGKIAHVGLSNVSVAQIEEACAIVPIASVQNRWNPGHRSPEKDGVLALCEKNKIALLCFSPFGGSTSAKGLGERAGLAAQAKKRGVSPHRLVLAWMLAKSPAAIPIPGVRRVETVTDSVAAAGMTLTAADVKEIEDSFD